MRRPNLTVDDAKAIERLAPSVGVVDIWMGQGSAARPPSACSTAANARRRGRSSAPPSSSPTVNFVKLSFGRFFTEAEVLRRRRVVVLGDNPYQALFEPSGIDPIGKKVRLGAIEYTVVGVLGKRPSRLPAGQDNFVVIPQTTHQVVFATNATTAASAAAAARRSRSCRVEGATRDQAIAEVEEIMRVRHGLKLDEPNDFDIGDAGRASCGSGIRSAARCSWRWW